MDAAIAVLDSYGNIATVTGSQSWTVTISSSSSQFVVTLSPVTIAAPATQSSTRFHVKYNGTGTASTILTAHATGSAPVPSDATMTVAK
jgi:hypothetical protein